MTHPRPASRRTGRREARQRAIELGVPTDVATRLIECGIRGPEFAKIARAGIPWSFINTLLFTGGLTQSGDVGGLIVLWDGPDSQDSVLAWARVGSLDAAYRLDALGMSPELAEAFHLGCDGVLSSLVRMVQEARKRGLRINDLLLWRTGGVLVPAAPWVHQELWETWRRIAVHKIGMRRAALSSAAGLSPAEAVSLVDGGRFDEDGLRVLAALRS